MNTKIFLLIILLIFFLIFSKNSFSQTQNVGIGTNTPDNSAILHLDVSNDINYPTKKGLLIPVMTASQRNSIISPAKGLLVFVPDDNNFYYNSGTSASPVWTVLLSSFNGILPVSQGGTGLGTLPANGQLLIGNGTDYSLATITSGTGINITNAAGSITISTTASAIDHNTLLNVQLAGVGVTYGHINAGDQDIYGKKTFIDNLAAPVFISNIADGTSPLIVTSLTKVINLNADMLDGKHSTDFIVNGGPAGGDLSGFYPDPTVVKIQGNAVIAGTPNDGQILRWKASNNQWEYYGPTGIVTSVTVNMPLEYSMTGNGSSGDVIIGGTWVSQSANKFFAGPVSGVDATPTFRLLDALDIPNLSTEKLTSGILPIARGGTGLGTVPTAGQILIGNGTDYSLKTLTQGAGITISSDATNITIASTVSGTVTSVGLALPSEFSISGSPVTGNGTLTGAWASQSANKVFAGPEVSGTGVPTFRSLVENDLPSISVLKLTGELPVVKGGTGTNTLTGMLMGNGTSAITGITNTKNNITFWADDNYIGGDSKVTWNGNKLFIDGDLEVTGIIDPKSLILIPQSAGPTDVKGELYYDLEDNKLMIRTATAYEPILTGALGAANGDVSGTYPTLTVTKIQGINVSTIDPTNGQILKYNGTDWAPADPSTQSETDPNVKAIMGIVKSDGTIISAAVSGTDYLAPFGSQSANTFYAAPSGGAGLPSFRIIDVTDIPNLDVAKITSGTLPVDRGGTGATTILGMLHGDGTTVAYTGITNTAGNLTYWSNANTISGDANLTWDSGNMKFKVVGNSEAITSTLTPQTSAPTGTEGSLYYNDTEKSLKVHDGTSWNNVGTGNLVVMRAYLNNYQDLPNDTTKILLDATSFDSHSSFSNSKFTAPVSGYYDIKAFLTSKIDANNASEFTQVFLFKNGSKVSDGTIGFSHNFGNGNTTNSILQELIYLAQNDYIEVYARCISTTRRVLNGSSLTYLTIHQVK